MLKAFEMGPFLNGNHPLCANNDPMLEQRTITEIKKYFIIGKFLLYANATIGGVEGALIFFGRNERGV